MLIIPSIKIRNGTCVHVVSGETGTENFYGFDPVRRAVLWRSENAKSLHVVDIDRAENGDRRNIDVIKKMTDSVVITVHLGGGLRTYDDVDEALNRLRVFRVIIDSMAIEDQDLVQRLVNEFTARKIIVEMNVKNDFVFLHDNVPTNLSSLEFASKMKQIGIERIIYKNSECESQQLAPPINELKQIADEANLNVTLNGCIRNYADLKSVQDLHHPKIDSIILSEVLHQNVFPCQKIWRIAEKMFMDYHDVPN